MYMVTEEFLGIAFSGDEPVTKTLWITDELRGPIEEILGHSFNALRVRYWESGNRTAWIIDEIGKEKPITIGVLIQAQVVDMVRVLEFREIRGWEIRYPFFTDQFNGARFINSRESRNQMLNRQVDGITGATLSVGAVTRVVKVVLYLSEQVGAPT